MLIPVILATSATGATQYQAPASAALCRAGLCAASDIDYAIADWRRLRQSDGYAFADYARFLINNPGWPGETTLRRGAERRCGPAKTRRRSSLSSAPIRRRSAMALPGWPTPMPRPDGQPRRSTAAREALAASGLSAYDEAESDRALRAELDRSRLRPARRSLAVRPPSRPMPNGLLPWTSPARRAAFQARIAMHLRSPDTEALYASGDRVGDDRRRPDDRPRALSCAKPIGRRPRASLLARPHNFIDSAGRSREMV